MPQLIPVPTFSDVRGRLSVFDGLLPFPIRRVYYLYGAAPGAQRAGHRHRTTRQALVCVAGHCEVYAHDGSREHTYRLDNPDSAVLLEAADWHSLHDFSTDAVVLVLASESYAPGDYIYEPYP